MSAEQFLDLPLCNWFFVWRVALGSAAAGGLSALAIVWLLAWRQRSRLPARVTPNPAIGLAPAVEFFSALTRRDRIVIRLVLAVIIIMALFPPWRIRRPTGGAYDLGYGFIASPPAYQGLLGEVDLVRLFIQWAVVVAVALALIKLRR